MPTCWGSPEAHADRPLPGRSARPATASSRARHSSSTRARRRHASSAAAAAYPLRQVGAAGAGACPPRSWRSASTTASTPTSWAGRAGRAAHLPQAALARSAGPTIPSSSPPPVRRGGLRGRAGGRHEAALPPRGRRARRASTCSATPCLNDVTARDLQARDGHRTRAKAFDTLLPGRAVHRDRHRSQRRDHRDLGQRRAARRSPSPRSFFPSRIWWRASPRS